MEVVVIVIAGYLLLIGVLYTADKFLTWWSRRGLRRAIANYEAVASEMPITVDDSELSARSQYLLTKHESAPKLGPFPRLLDNSHVVSKDWGPN